MPSSSQPVRVLYDLSVLAEAYDRPESRTGVLRVVERLAHALASREDCAVGFTTRESLAGLERYLRLHPNLPARMQQSRFSIAGSRLFDPLRRFVWASRKNRSFLFRGMRRGSRLLTESLEPVFTNVPPQRLEAFDIFHAPCALLSRQIRSATRLPKVVTLYDMIPLRSPEFFGPEVLAMARQRMEECRRPDTWAVAISQATKDDFCDYTGVAPERVFVTPLAAPDHFRRETDPAVVAAIRQRYSLPDAPYLLSVCTLEPRKNLQSVIAGFAEVVRAEKISDLHLVLVGNVGWFYEKIFTEYEQYPELRSRIHFTGFAEDADLPAIYSGALGFLYLSVYEGFGLPPLEAMQCGVPTITSNVSSLPEVVGAGAIQVPPHDITSICAAILRLYRDPAERARLAAAGLARAREFSWARCAEATVAAYRTIISQ